MRGVKIGLYLFGMVMALIYLLNPGAGVFELVPDQLPIIGHVDEAAMMALFMSCMRGWRRLRAVEESSAAAAMTAASDTIS